MKQSFNKTALLAAVAVAGVVSAPLASAAVNPFSNTELASGYNFDHPEGHKAGGEKKDDAAAKCDETKKDKKQCENKDGDKKADAVPGHSEKAAAEGKCGEGKCGEAMMDN